MQLRATQDSSHNASNNKQFDAHTPGKPFEFKICKGRMIKGLNVGILGMKVYGKRRLTIRPAMAFAKVGSPPDIQPHSTIVYEVDCKFVKETLS